MKRRRIAALVVCAAMVLSVSGCRQRDYNAAISLTQFNEWVSARRIFVELGNYRNAANRVKQCDYHFATVAMEEKRYDDAIAMFEALGDYQDSEDCILECHYREAMDAFQDEQYEKAGEQFAALGDYSDSAEKALESRYRKGQKLYLSENYEQCIEAFREAEGYEDAEHYIVLAKLRGDPEGFIRNMVADMNGALSDIRLEADANTYTTVLDERKLTVTFSHESAGGQTVSHGQINKVTIAVDSYTVDTDDRAESEFVVLSSVLMAVMADTADRAGCEGQLTEQMGSAEEFEYQGCDCRVSVSGLDSDGTRRVFTMTVPELVE